jgi:hypothetical protein
MCDGNLRFRKSQDIRLLMLDISTACSRPLTGSLNSLPLSFPLGLPLAMEGFPD